MEQKTIKNAVIYARTACVGQMDGQDGMRTQIEKVRRFAKKNGYLVVGEFIDYGRSGTDTHRHGLQKLLRELGRAKCQTVLARDPARLSRSAIQLHELISYFQKKGVEVIFTNNNANI